MGETPCRQGEKVLVNAFRCQRARADKAIGNTTSKHFQNGFRIGVAGRKAKSLDAVVSLEAHEHLVGGGDCKITHPVRTFVFRSSKDIYIKIRDFCCHALILVIVKEAVSSRTLKSP